MDTAFDDQFFVRVQFPVAQFFRDDLKASFLYVHRLYIFKFNLHQIVSFSGSIPSSSIS